MRLDEIRERYPNSNVYLADDDYCRLDEVDGKYKIEKHGNFFKIVYK